MSAGPLRRLLGALGLAALVPIAWQLATGALAPTDAAVRAIVTFAAVVVLGRLAATWIAAVARSYDGRPARDAGAERTPEATSPRAPTDG